MNAHVIQPRTNIMTIVEILDREKLTQQDELVNRFLSNQAAYDFQRLTPINKANFILDEVCRVFDITRDKLSSLPNTKHKSFIKKIFYYTAKKKVNIGFLKVASLLKQTSHASASNALKEIPYWVLRENANPEFTPYWNKFINNAPSFIIPDKC